MFACIYIPDFPVEAIVRAEPLLRKAPVAVLEGKSPVVRVIGLNEKARRLGMELGMTKLQAAMFAGENKPTSFNACPSAVLRQRCLQQEESAHCALLDVAHAFTPRVEDTARDTFLLDLCGLERLYSGLHRMAQELTSRVNALGMTANIAVAANPDTAMHAARGFHGTTVIPAGEEAHRLRVLPLLVLLETFDIVPDKLSKNAGEQEKRREQILDTVERWGVRDFRSLAELPEQALASRLGEVGVRLQRLARGAGMRTLVLCEPSSHFEEAMELESPVETIESLSFILNRLLEQLCTRLEARALAAQELHLRLLLEHRISEEESFSAQELAATLDNSGIAEAAVFRRTLRLPVAVRDARIFLKLLQLELAAHQPGAPVIKVWITAAPAPPRWTQRGLFLPPSPDAEKMEITLARISKVVGERRAGIARLQDTHRRAHFCLERFSLAVEIKRSANPTLSDRGQHSQLALRVFRPQRRLRVSLADGRPVSLASIDKHTCTRELQGKVLWSAGPWRSSGDWWTNNAKQESSDEAAPWDREEWDIALANETNNNVVLYRIHRDVGSGQWFADASYD